MALSDVKVRSAKPEAKAYKLTDGDGMVLLVHPNGSKYWRLRYRFGGKEKMLALGKYPEVSLADARARRDEAGGAAAKARTVLTPAPRHATRCTMSRHITRRRSPIWPMCQQSARPAAISASPWSLKPHWWSQ